VKVVMLGASHTGKTSLTKRFLDDTFVPKYQSTIGAAYGSRKLRVNSKDVVIGVWDTAGEEKFESLTRTYYREAFAAVVCYAVNDENSWNKVKFWIKELKKAEDDCKIYICATKIDLIAGRNCDNIRASVMPQGRAVDYHTTTDYAQDVGAKLFETSSKDGLNITEMFEDIAKEYLRSDIHNDRRGIDISRERSIEKFSCAKCYKK